MNREATGGWRPRPGGQRARWRRASRSDLRRASLAGPTAASQGSRERQGSRGSGGARLGGETRRAPATPTGHALRSTHWPGARTPQEATPLPKPGV